MEANIEPKNDPNLKVEWFLNGKRLEEASRVKTTYDFGLVTLDLKDCNERDQGIYTCRGYNKVSYICYLLLVDIDQKCLSYNDCVAGY